MFCRVPFCRSDDAETLVPGFLQQALHLVVCFFCFGFFPQHHRNSHLWIPPVVRRIAVYLMKIYLGADHPVPFTRIFANCLSSRFEIRVHIRGKPRKYML